MNDDDLDRRLHEYGDQWRSEQLPPPAPQLPQRHLPRWVPVAAAAAAAVTIAAGVSVAVARSDHSASPAGPGPSASPSPTVSRPSPTSDAARACTGADIAAGPGHLDGTAGTMYYPVPLRNVSTTPCLLSGYPSVVATAAGRPDVTATRATYAAAPGTRAIAPGDSATVLLRAPGLCSTYPGGAPADPYNHYVIRLPGGGSTSFTGETLNLGCGLGASQVYVE